VMGMGRSWWDTEWFFWAIIVAIIAAGFFYPLVVGNRPEPPPKGKNPPHGGTPAADAAPDTPTPQYQFRPGSIHNAPFPSCPMPYAHSYTLRRRTGNRHAKWTTSARSGPTWVTSIRRIRRWLSRKRQLSPLGGTPFRWVGPAPGLASGRGGRKGRIGPGPRLPSLMWHVLLES